MSKDALPCIVCGTTLLNVMEECENQPEDGLAFKTYGHYGSTIFDPVDGSILEINVCDDCLVRAGERGRVYAGKDYRHVLSELREGPPLPVVVGREWLDRPLVPWRKDLPGYGEGDSVYVEPEEVGTDMPRIEWTIEWTKEARGTA